jgi:hypothetical protein
MYLFENDIIEPLKEQLINSCYSLEPLSTKCSGARVLTMLPKKTNNQMPTEALFDTVYMLYKEYIGNFSPNLNCRQVLLYIYKHIFNIKYISFTPEYSLHLTKLLATSIVMKFI